MIDRLAAQILADAHWYPGAGLDPAAVHVTDSLTIGDQMLLWTVVRGQPGRLVLLAARRRRTRLRPASPAAALLSLAARARWHTAAGGTVSWTGLRGEARPVGHVGATASNDVLRIRLNGCPALVKAYRLVGDGRAEHRALIAAAPGRLAPTVLAWIGYRGPAAPGQAPLALITEAISGLTLDVPLRRSLELAWRSGDGELTEPDRDLLRGVRQAVHALHRCLPPRSRPARQPLAIRLPELLADVDVIRLSLPADGPAHRLLDLAAHRAVATAAGAGFVPGAVHGDLHLSNVLVHGGQVRFVDPGSSSAAAAPPDDFAALRRGVECLCLDLLVSADGWRPRAALVRGDRTAIAAGVAEQWCAGVVAELCGQPAGRLGELCYLARLLHDLRYHTERGQAYYADLAWWHLARLLLPRPAMPPEADTVPAARAGSSARADGIGGSGGALPPEANTASRTAR